MTGDGGEAARRAGKKRLGKGLSALLGEYLPEERSEREGYRTVPVARIAPNPVQPRRTFVEEELAELAASIRENGLLQPLVVRPAGPDAPEGAEWELVAGERRWRAVRRLEWSEVPAVVREIDDRTMLVLAIVENIQRAELSPLEEAAGYQQLINEFGYTQKEVAESVGKDRSTIANLLRLQQLPASVQRLVSEGQLSMGHARALLGLEDERQMADLARRSVDQGLSVRAVEDTVRRRREGPEPGRTRGKSKRAGGAEQADPHLRHVEAQLQRVLGTKVRVRVEGARAGQVEIPFYNADDFDRVIELLLGPGGVEF